MITRDVINKLSVLYMRGDVTPLQATIELTNKCVFDCPWCTVPKGVDTLDYTVIRDLFYDLRRNWVRQVILTGGEPLLHPDVAEIINIACGSFNVGIEITGDILTSDIACAISKCAFVKIPIESFNCADFNRLRNCSGQRIQNIISNIKYLNNYKKSKSSRCEIVVECKDGLINTPAKETAEFCIDLGVDILLVKPVRIRSGEIKVTDMLFPYIQLSNKKWYNNFKVIIAPSNGVGKARNYSKCIGHYLNTYISADGRVSLCADHKSDPEYFVGNINRQSFSDIWEGLPRLDLVRDLDLSHCPPSCECDNINTEFQSNSEDGFNQFI